MTHIKRLSFGERVIRASQGLSSCDEVVQGPTVEGFHDSDAEWAGRFSSPMLQPVIHGFEWTPGHGNHAVCDGRRVEREDIDKGFLVCVNVLQNWKYVTCPKCKGIK